MAEPVVQTIGLTKVFKDFWRRDKVHAVDDLSFELQPGEVFGLLGPNGSGKSTTVKLLLGLLFPTRGVARVFGQSPRRLDVKRQIGFLPEETYLYPYLNAEETLDFYGRVFELPRAERRRRIEALIKMVGLAGASKRRLGEYSKGMARRIGLAQALIGDPALVLLDEPTTGLDPIGTAEVKELIAELKRRGKTVLLCSHLLADVEDVCDRVAILYGGRVRATGKVSDLLSEERITQISVPDPAPGTVEAIRELIREREGEKEIGVGHPFDRLESFFLRVVAQAHEEQATTSGAQLGDIKADIYGEAVGPAEEGDAVIDRLLSAQDEAGPADVSKEASQERTPEPKVEVLQRLGHANESEPASEKQPPPPPPVAKDDGRSKAVLARLLGSDRGDEADEQ